MKKALLLAVFACVCLSACKKDKPTVKTYKVTLNATGFTQQIINLAKTNPHTPALNRTAANLSYIPRLLYYVEDVAGTYGHSLEQDSSSTNLGTIEDYLPAGTYNVYMAAGGPGLRVTAGSTPAFVSLGYNGAWKDTFYGHVQITVSGDVNQSITLNRVVGELELDVLDAIPANAVNITMSVSSEDFINQPGATPAPSSPAELQLPFTIPATSLGVSNTTYVSFINNTISPFTVVINCYDRLNAVLATATINNVSCQVNKKTILQGKLFGSSVGFGLTLNPMSPTIINLPF